MSKKKAAPKKAAPKPAAKKAAPKKVTIKGFEGKVNLKKEILKPISKQVKGQFAATRPKDKQKGGIVALKSTNKLIKKLAADGKLGKKDLEKINKFTAQNKLGRHFEPKVLSNAVSSSITAAQYRDFTKSQQQKLSGFRKDQTKIVNKSLQKQVGQLQSMIGFMGQDASSALEGFSSILSSSMDASSAMFEQQRQAFDAQNRQSEANIRAFQSQIVGLPAAPAKTSQIGTAFDKVSAGSEFAKIGQLQAPIQVGSSPALTGFSSQQRESQARQIQGLSGFRSSRT
jgi:hypothetical protein